MLLHVISEQTHCSSSRIVYISTTEKLDKCKSIICEKYKLTEEDWEYMKQWGEKYKSKGRNTFEAKKISRIFLTFFIFII